MVGSVRDGFIMDGMAMVPMCAQVKKIHLQHIYQEGSYSMLFLCVASAIFKVLVHIHHHPTSRLIQLPSPQRGARSRAVLPNNMLFLCVASAICNENAPTREERIRRLLVMASMRTSREASRERCSIDAYFPNTMISITFKV